MRARLVGSDLEVNESKLDDLASLDLLDTNWRTVWESHGQLEGPAVSIGTRIFGAGGAEDLGNEIFRRQALDLVCAAHRDRSAGGRGSWFAMKRKIAAIYPAHAVGGTSYANGLTRMIYLHQGKSDNDWHPDTVLMSSCTCGTTTTTTARSTGSAPVCSLRGEHPIDLDTHNTQENPNVAFAEGCSEWASNALRARALGRAAEKAAEPPLCRAVAAD